MEVVLVMFRSAGDRRSFPVNRDVTLVGRRDDCDLRIPVGEVSRKHCRIVRDGPSLRVEDLGSANGTYHNGARLQSQSAELLPGDSIRVGPVVFVVQIDGEPADDALKPFLERKVQSLSDSATMPAPVGKSAEDALNEGALEVMPEMEGEPADAEVQLHLDSPSATSTAKSPKA